MARVRSALSSFMLGARNIGVRLDAIAKRVREHGAACAAHDLRETAHGWACRAERAEQAARLQREPVDMSLQPELRPYRTVATAERFEAQAKRDRRNAERYRKLAARLEREGLPPELAGFDPTKGRE